MEYSNIGTQGRRRKHITKWWTTVTAKQTVIAEAVEINTFKCLTEYEGVRYESGLQTTR